MIMVDANGVPLAVHTCSARPAEVKLVHDTLDGSFGMDFPKRLIGDKAYDSDGLDAELATFGISMIAPNRRNRRKTQDGRPLRRYKRRWKVERTIAWLQSFRRVRTPGSLTDFMRVNGRRTASRPPAWSEEGLEGASVDLGAQGLAHPGVSGARTSPDHDSARDARPADRF